MNHINRAYLCPDCNGVGFNPMRCDCGNSLGLLNLGLTAINRDPLFAETMAIMEMLKEVGRERLA